MGGLSCVFAVFQLSAVTYVATGSGTRGDRIISAVPFFDRQWSQGSRRQRHLVSAKVRKEPNREFSKLLLLL